MTNSSASFLKLAAFESTASFNGAIQCGQLIRKSPGILPITVDIVQQELKPHIFIVAEEAYRNVRGQLKPANQSLVVSGESGAGKVNTDK